MPAIVAFVFLSPTAWAQIQDGKPLADGTGTGEVVRDGSIAGRVISASTGEPLPGITVGLFLGRQPPPMRTDTEGRFHFAGLEAVTYGVAVWPDSGYIARKLLVNLKAERKVTGIELKGYQPAVLSGRVADAQERPVAGVWVSALGAANAVGRYPPGRHGSLAPTNDLGEYRISGLSPARYRLLVERAPLEIHRKDLGENEDPADLEPVTADVATYYPNSSSLAGAGSLAVELGQVLEGMDITIAQEATVCMQSRVSDPEGNNLAPIHVRVTADLYLGAATVAEGVVGGGAGVEVCGLPPGSYRLVAGLADREQGARYASEPFQITTRGVRVPDIYLRPLIPLPGRLTIDTEGDEVPLPEPVRVSLTGSGRPGNLDERPFVQVTEEGPFVIPAVLPEEYWLTVKTPAGFYVKSAAMAGADVLREPLHAAGDDLTVVLGQDGASLSVKVIDEESHPVYGATVILGRDPLPPRFAPDDLTVRPTDQSGQAVFEGIAPGDYRLLAYGDLWDETAPLTGEFFEAHRLEGDAVELGPRESRTVQFKVLNSQ